ncbi:HET-domain-containing protein [Marasmius fiardii PR-910]|nr:HET-domain-containing protein [Marasmius fiardii PR-910]
MGPFTSASFQVAWDAQTSYRDYSYSTTWNQIQTSAEWGCHWCKILLSSKPEASMQQDAVRLGVEFRISSGSNGETPRGLQNLRLVVNGMPHSVYYVYTQADDCAAAFVTARPRVLQLKQPSTHKMALTCITDCIRDHEHCHRPCTTTLPTRVIDCSDPKNLRLHLGANVHAQYLALSYVWGESQPHRTTTKNLDMYLKRINHTLLPQTILDAIEITRALNVRYLWVDALCILQDSEPDKAREIAQMRAIYSNAYLTLTAASAQRVSEGFLQDRTAPSHTDVSLPFLCPDGKLGSMVLTPVWGQYDGSLESVNNRAWCLEERLLSPRVLIYASHTLQFQCQTSIVNVGNAVCGPMLGQRLPEIIFRSDELFKPLSPTEYMTLRWSWLEIVTDYTRRSVTKPKDKLVAFAAISELFGRSWRTQYLAGLWHHSLNQDVLWYKNFDTRFDRPEVYRAPSWSWAAVDGAILAFSMDDRLNEKGTETCEIVNCEVATLIPILPFGAVTSGTLTLRASMSKASWDPEAPMPNLYLQAEDSDLCGDAVHIGCAYPDAVEHVQKVWAVPVRWNKAERYVAGLIVARTSQDLRYRRVGYFHSLEDAPSIAWIDEGEPQDIVIV